MPFIKTQSRNTRRSIYKRIAFLAKTCSNGVEADLRTVVVGLALVYVRAIIDIITDEASGTQRLSGVQYALHVTFEQ